MLRLFIGALLAILSMPVRSGPVAAGQIMDLDGAWFSCEFAHSQIPPEDGCRMLDDDGFLIIDGAIDHIKVQNSRQTACRQNRVGNCFWRTRPEVIVERNAIGKLRPTEEGFQVDYWGCTQDYKMRQRSGFFEIRPVSGLCLWASDKRYFLARFNGQLKVTSEKAELAVENMAR